MLSIASMLRLAPLALAFIAGYAAAAAIGCQAQLGPWPRLHEYRAQLEADLSFLRARVTAPQIVCGQLLVAGLLLATSWLSWSAWPLATLTVLAWGPGAVLDHLVSARRRRIEEQLDGWLVSLANSLHATPALGGGLETSTQAMRGPMADEIDLVLKQHRLGTPLEEALARMAQRVNSRALSGAVMLLRLALRTGGNLPSTLQSTAATLREISRLEGVVRTKTAEGRGQTRLIGMLPFPLLAAVHLMDPSFLAPLGSSSQGHAVIAGSVLLWCMAVTSAHHIMKVDI